MNRPNLRHSHNKLNWHFRIREFPDIFIAQERTHILV